MNSRLWGVVYALVIFLSIPASVSAELIFGSPNTTMRDINTQRIDGTNYLLVNKESNLTI